MGHFYARKGGVDALGGFIKSGAAKATIPFNLAELSNAKRCFLKAGELDNELSKKSKTDWLAKYMDQLIELAKSLAK